MPVPMIWEGKKGEVSKAVMPFDLNVRPFMDGKYIIPKTIEYIKRNAAANKPFFVYVGYSEMHPPLIGNPDFVGKSTERGGLFADLIAEMDYRVGQVHGRHQGSRRRRQHHRYSKQRQWRRRCHSASRAQAPMGPWRGDFMNTPFEGSHARAVPSIRWPGKVPAGVVTQEMLAAVDWLPTLAGIAGASNLVPKDRPIDGVDASAVHARQERNDRARVLHVFRYRRRPAVGQMEDLQDRSSATRIIHCDQPSSSAYVKPQFPMCYDLSSDPHEDNNLFYSDLTNAWMLGASLKTHRRI